MTGRMTLQAGVDFVGSKIESKLCDAVCFSRELCVATAAGGMAGTLDRVASLRLQCLRRQTNFFRWFSVGQKWLQHGRHMLNFAKGIYLISLVPACYLPNEKETDNN